MCVWLTVNIHEVGVFVAKGECTVAAQRSNTLTLSPAAVRDSEKPGTPKGVPFYCVLIIIHNLNHVKMASKNIFNTIQLSRPNRNMFDLSHDVKLSLPFGSLVPIMCTELVPGDSIQIGCESLLRFAPMLSPAMHMFHVTMHYFFVPNRILWGQWEQFITGNYPSAPGTPAFPTVTMGPGGSYTRLCDYFGIPDPSQTPGSAGRAVNALPFAAYQKIYDDYYRDQNLIDQLVAPGDYIVSSGSNDPNASMLLQLRTRAWSHDYLTSCLPFAQKGPDVTLPVGTFVDVPVLRNDTGGPTILDGTPDDQQLLYQASTNPGMGPDEIYARTSDLTADAATINELRRAFKLQEWFERNARGGTRYSEHILAHFDVKSDDARLQRPEYITGTKSPVVISEVLNTAGTFSAGDPTSPPQGNMSGHGASVTQGGYGHYFAKEHGFVIGIMSVMPQPAYQQGFEKFWLKTEDPFQYFYPTFANIGEQEVFNEEVMGYLPIGETSADNKGVFGYIPRYAEYRFCNSRVAGQFRTSLQFWHAGRIFGNGAPVPLNQGFVEFDSEESTDRLFAVLPSESTDQLYAHVFNKIKASRLMPKFGTPKFG